MGFGVSRRILAAGALSLALGNAAWGNSGTQLPLNQYQAGTENATLVANGGFETISGSDATIWLESGGGGMSAAGHVGPNSSDPSFGDFGAQAGTVDDATYSMNVSFDPGVPYVLSAYMWNFGNAGPAPHDETDFDPGDMAVVELVDLVDSHKKTILLEPIAFDGGNGSDGYFLYTTIPADEFPSGARLDVRNDLDSPGPWPDVVTQYDNVALTKADDFSPPSQIPEPTGLSLMFLGGLLALRRRRA